MAEINSHTSLGAQSRMLRHFSALIPAQHSAQFDGQTFHRIRNGFVYRLRTMSGKCGAVLLSQSSMPFHSRQVK
jgi:hypothetical protein